MSKTLTELIVTDRYSEANELAFETMNKTALTAIEEGFEDDQLQAHNEYKAGDEVTIAGETVTLTESGAEKLNSLTNIVEKVALRDCDECEDLATEEYDISEEEYNEMPEEGVEIDEGRFKKVIRGGKLKKKLVCRDGFKAKNGRCVKITGTEKQTQRKSQRKRVRTLKGKGKGAARAMDRKRKKSMKKAKSFGLVK